MKPFRVVLLLLALIAAIELWGIFHTPTYGKELTDAQKAYYEALYENAELIRELEGTK